MFSIASLRMVGWLAQPCMSMTFLHWEAWNGIQYSGCVSPVLSRGETHPDFPWPTGNACPAQQAAGSCPPGPPDPFSQSCCPASQPPVYTDGWGLFLPGAGLISQCWMPWDSLRASSTETSNNEMSTNIARALLPASTSAPHWSVTPDREVLVRARAPGSQQLIKTHLILMLKCSFADLNDIGSRVKGTVFRVSGELLDVLQILGICSSV